MGRLKKGTYRNIGNFLEAKSSWLQVFQKKRLLWVNFLQRVKQPAHCVDTIIHHTDCVDEAHANMTTAQQEICVLDIFHMKNYRVK